MKERKTQTAVAELAEDLRLSNLATRPISAIDGALVTEALAPIWTKKPETARRVKQRIERVTQWVGDGQLLPMHRASKRVRHHPATLMVPVPSTFEAGGPGSRPSLCNAGA